MKISVVIPVYNVEKFLEECIDSVLAQTFQDFEIILVDDGSTDNSAQICDKYAQMDKRIKVIHKENGGASTARNVGLDVAKGEYIYFLDSDDHIDENALEKLLNPLVENAADFSFCQAYAVDEETSKVSLSNYAYHRDYGTGKGKDFFEEMLDFKEFHVAVWQNLYKKDFLEKNNLRFFEGIMYEDCIFAFKIYCLAEKIVHINEYLYFRRYRANSVMTSKKTERNFVSALNAFKEVDSFNKRVSDYINTDKYLSRIAYNVINNYSFLDGKLKNKHKNDYKDFIFHVSKNDYYNDKSLKWACKGKFYWLIYKVITKVIG